MHLSHVLVDNRRWLWLVIYSRLGDASQTEDVLQEVAVAAAGSESEFGEPDAAKNWLYRVAIRQVMLLRRRQSRRRANLQDYRDDLPPPDAESLIEWMCSDETSQQVREAVAQLQPHDQQVLAMKYGEDFSCRQMAEVLGVAESTVQSRLLRARRRLRGLLVRNYQFEDPEHA